MELPRDFLDDNSLSREAEVREKRRTARRKQAEDSLLAFSEGIKHDSPKDKVDCTTKRSNKEFTEESDTNHKPLFFIPKKQQLQEVGKSSESDPGSKERSRRKQSSLSASSSGSETGQSDWIVEMLMGTDSSDSGQDFGKFIVEKSEVKTTAPPADDTKTNPESGNQHDDNISWHSEHESSDGRKTEEDINKVSDGDGQKCDFRSTEVYNLGHEKEGKMGDKSLLSASSSDPDIYQSDWIEETEMEADSSDSDEDFGKFFVNKMEVKTIAQTILDNGTPSENNLSREDSEQKSVNEEQVKEARKMENEGDVEKDDISSPKEKFVLSTSSSCSEVGQSDWIVEMLSQAKYSDSDEDNGKYSVKKDVVETADKSAGAKRTSVEIEPLVDDRGLQNQESHCNSQGMTKDKHNGMKVENCAMRLTEDSGPSVGDETPNLETKMQGAGLLNDVINTTSIQEIVQDIIEQILSSVAERVEKSSVEESNIPKTNRSDGETNDNVAKEVAQSIIQGILSSVVKPGENSPKHPREAKLALDKSGKEGKGYEKNGIKEDYDAKINEDSSDTNSRSRPRQSRRDTATHCQTAPVVTASTFRQAGNQGEDKSGVFAPQATCSAPTNAGPVARGRRSPARQRRRERSAHSVQGRTERRLPTLSREHLIQTDSIRSRAGEGKKHQVTSPKKSFVTRGEERKVNRSEGVHVGEASNFENQKNIPGGDIRPKTSDQISTETESEERLNTKKTDRKHHVVVDPSGNGRKLSKPLEMCKPDTESADRAGAGQEKVTLNLKERDDEDRAITATNNTRKTSKDKRNSSKGSRSNGSSDVEVTSDKKQRRKQSRKEGSKSKAPVETERIESDCNSNDQGEGNCHKESRQVDDDGDAGIKKMKKSSRVKNKDKGLRKKPQTEKQENSSSDDDTNNKNRVKNCKGADGHLVPLNIKRKKKLVRKNKVSPSEDEISEVDSSHSECKTEAREKAEKSKSRLPVSFKSTYSHSHFSYPPEPRSLTYYPPPVYDDPPKITCFGRLARNISRLAMRITAQVFCCTSIDLRKNW